MTTEGPAPSSARARAPGLPPSAERPLDPDRRRRAPWCSRSCSGSRSPARRDGRSCSRPSSAPRSPWPRSRASPRGSCSTSACCWSPRRACSCCRSPIAAIRTLRGPVFFPLRALAAGYTDLFRGMPLIIVLYLIGYGIPALRFSDTRIPAEVLGTIALVLTYSAYVSEVWRAGIEAVHPSQRLAARALGLSYGKHAAARRAAAGVPQGDPRADERLRRHAEGRRPDLRARRGGCGAGRPDRGRPHLHLHPLRRRGAAVRAARAADDPADRLAERRGSGGASRSARCCDGGLGAARRRRSQVVRRPRRARRHLARARARTRSSRSSARPDRASRRCCAA